MLLKTAFLLGNHSTAAGSNLHLNHTLTIKEWENLGYVQITFYRTKVYGRYSGVDPGLILWCCKILQEKL